MSDKPLNDEFDALDAAETDAEHGLDAHPSENRGDDLTPLDAVIAERDEWKDRALRVAAEMENLKRRSETQQNDARAFAIQRFAKDLLGVADNLERALMAAPKDAEGATAGLVTGLELTQKAPASGLRRQWPETRRARSRRGLQPAPAPGDDGTALGHRARRIGASDHAVRL